MQALAAGAAALGLAASEVQALLGESIVDVWLNANVWRYQLGGYQVIKKWLSYREKNVLGRPLRVEEVQYLTEMARCIAAILLLGHPLDANFRAAKRAGSDECAGPL
jgi:hypothetical protein